MIRRIGLRTSGSLACACVLLCLGATRVRAQQYNPNVVIELDNSQSMRDLIPALPPYVATTPYNVGTGTFTFTPSAVYQFTSNGSYQTFSPSTNTFLTQYNNPSAVYSLSQYGLWFGSLGGNSAQVQLYLGNFLNYAICPTGTNPNACTSPGDIVASFRKIDVAKSVVAQMAASIPNIYLGVVDFNNAATNYNMVVPIPNSTTTIVNDVYAVGIATTAGTPSGYTLTSIAGYYNNQLPGYPTPVQGTCQANSVILISDGLYTGGSGDDPATPAGQYHTSTPYWTVDTIALDPPSDPNSPKGIADLQLTAQNGGGTFFLANSSGSLFSTQLEQALFNLPTSVNISTPANFSTSSGTILITVNVPNPGCDSVVQIYIDGQAVGPQLPGKPGVFNYSYLWNSRTVANGGHYISAQEILTGTNGSVWAPTIDITIDNDLTPPSFEFVNGVAFITSATVSWTTYKGSTSNFVLANSQVDYDTTPYTGGNYVYRYSTPVQDSTGTINHVVHISTLTPNTLYNFEVLSEDLDGNQGILGNFTFTTRQQTSNGPLAQFSFTFGSNNQAGPGSQSGTYPWVLTVGYCTLTTVYGLDSNGRPSNYTGPVAISQWSLDANGSRVGLAPGIALQNNFELGLSSFTINMVDGLAYMGANNDDLCFYRATEQPGNQKQPGSPGDQQISAQLPHVSSVTSYSSSYVTWYGKPAQMALATFGQTLAPATPGGLSGVAATLNEGAPFPMTAYLTDQYWNLIQTGNDDVQFASSLSTETGFAPSSGSGYLSAGVFSATATVVDCRVGVTLTVNDVTTGGINPAQYNENAIACASNEYFTLSIPTSTAAGQTFIATVTVMNVDTPANGGSVLYSGNLSPLIQSGSGFIPAPGPSLGVSVFSFYIPQGVRQSSWPYAITNESYQKSQQIYIQLAGTSPSDLNGATFIAGPLQVNAGLPTQMALKGNPQSLGAYGNAQITATVWDQYGNGVSSQDVHLQITQGGGGLGPNGNLTSEDFNTNNSGQALFNFTSGGVSETDVLTATDESATYIPPVNFDEFVSLLNGKTLSAYPSPVKLAQGPLSIEYQLSQDSDVTLTIADMFGRQVWRQSYSAGATGGQSGFNLVTWNGTNGGGSTVATGVYALHLSYSANGQTQKASTKFAVWK